MSKIKWVKPDFKTELAEYFNNSYAKTFFKKRGLVFKYKPELEGFLSAGKLERITKQMLLANPDNISLTEADFKIVIKDEEYSASYISMCEALIQEGSLTMPAPIIIKFGRTYYGYAGNKRINLAFRNKIPLMVWLVSTTVLNPTNRSLN